MLPGLPLPSLYLLGTQCLLAGPLYELLGLGCLHSLLPCLALEHLRLSLEVT